MCNGARFERLLRADPGFRSEGVFTVRVRTPPEFFPKDREVIAFQDRVRHGLAAIPGATGASAALESRSLPVHPTEVLRLAAPCAGSACQHFDGANCQLATRTVQLLPILVTGLPACVIRATCRWWLQEGREACLRCPQVVTRMYEPTDEQLRAAEPTIVC